MAAWETAIITNKGIALLAKLSSGNSLYLTRAVSGAGYVDPSLLPEMTAVTDQKQALQIGIQNYTDDGLCNVPIKLSNDGVTTAYTAKQVGIIALDPDEGEILFLISQARNGEGTNVPTESDIPGFSAEWTFSIQYGQADGVNITVDPANTVSVTEAQHMIDNTITERLGNVNNTSDSEKHVLYAGTAGSANKVKNNLIIRLNGGRTEGTDMFTYDGSTSRSVNITPANIGIETKSGTVTSQNADYAEVGEWADGNPDADDRIGYFVCVDLDNPGIIMKKATANDVVRGVTVAAPAFSGNCAKEKYDAEGNLLPRYNYVAVMGIVPVIDNGTCTVGGRCMPASDSTAAPVSGDYGYQVMERVDSTHVLIAVEPGADAQYKFKSYVDGKFLFGSVTLKQSGWSGNSQSVAVAGVTADNSTHVLASPETGIAEQYAAYCENGVYCASQGNGALTFVCDSVPDVDLTVNIALVTNGGALPTLPDAEGVAF